MTTFDILDRAERIEQLAADIYDALALQFAGDPKARALFERLRDEELQHANRVRMLGSQSRSDRKLMAKLEVDPREMELVFGEMVGLLKRLRAGGWTMDLAATKRLLLELEERCSRAHAHLLYQGVHDGLRRFFEQLAAQDKAHEELLRE